MTKRIVGDILYTISVKIIPLFNSKILYIYHLVVIFANNLHMSHCKKNFKLYHKLADDQIGLYLPTFVDWLVGATEEGSVLNSKDRSTMIINGTKQILHEIICSLITLRDMVIYLTYCH